MTSFSSSQDLHPASGARYLFERQDDEAGASPRYAVAVYVADGTRVSTTLCWDERGEVVLEPTVASDALRGELLKLARVVKRSGQQRLSRWRG